MSDLDHYSVDELQHLCAQLHDLHLQVCALEAGGGFRDMINKTAKSVTSFAKKAANNMRLSDTVVSVTKSLKLYIEEKFHDQAPRVHIGKSDKQSVSIEFLSWDRNFAVVKWYEIIQIREKLFEMHFYDNPRKKKPIKTDSNDINKFKREIKAAIDDWIAHGEEYAHSKQETESKRKKSIADSKATRAAKKSTKQTHVQPSDTESISSEDSEQDNNSTTASSEDQSSDSESDTHHQESQSQYGDASGRFRRAANEVLQENKRKLLRETQHVSHGSHDNESFQQYSHSSNPLPYYSHGLDKASPIIGNLHGVSKKNTAQWASANAKSQKQHGSTPVHSWHG